MLRMCVGGKDEAWCYRQDHLDLWQSSGGLEWLLQQSSRTKNLKRDLKATRIL